jgi:diaminopimelate epimerase
MKIPFFKMEAQGNDYVYVDLDQVAIEEQDLSNLAVAVSKRNFGVGGDGLVTIDASNLDLIDMRIFNADGSEAEMCGSALRCIVWYIATKHRLKEVTVQTKGGIKKGELLSDGSVEVNMGPAKIISELTELNGYQGYYVDMGNPHFVTYTEISHMDFIHKAPKMENMVDSYCERRNIEFVRTNSANSVDVKVWERGSGATLACGTGATAVVAVGIMLKRLSNEVQVTLPGGTVIVQYKESIDNYILKGKVNCVFEGIYYYKKVN